MTVHPDARQRICEEIDRTVWPIDRKFFRDNPKRSYWLRPAQQVEISEKEVINGGHIPVAPGALALIAVRQVVPGVRMRTLIVIDDPPPGPVPRNLPEHVCRDWYHAYTNPNCEGLTVMLSEEMSERYGDKLLEWERAR